MPRVRNSESTGISGKIPRDYRRALEIMTDAEAGGNISEMLRIAIGEAAVRRGVMKQVAVVKRTKATVLAGTENG